MAAPAFPERLRFFCQKVLPAVYDDSLSYYEAICKIADSLDKCIDYLTYLDEEIITWDELNPKLDALQGQIDEIKTAMREYDRHFEQLDNETARLDQRVTDEVALLHQYVIDQINLRIGEVELYLKQYADSGDQHVISWATVRFKAIHEFLERMPELDAKLFNPTKGYSEPAQDVLEDVYEWDRYFAMTALDYHAAGKTATELDAEGRTARWDDTAGYLLHMRKKPCECFDPTTGLVRPIEDVIFALYQQLGSSMNVTAFEAKNAAASTLDSYNRTAARIGLYGWFATSGLSATLDMRNQGTAPYAGN